MKRIIAIAVVLAFAGIASAATVTASVKGQARFEQGPGILVSSWHMADLIVTYARNDTVPFTRDINPYFNSTSIASFMGAYTTNNAGADSGDITCKIEIGWDSAAYYTIPKDTVKYRTDFGADSITTVWDGYAYNRLLNDSTLTYPLFTVQPKAATGGYKLALPLQWPKMHDGETIPFTRFRLIFSKGSKFKNGDTTWVKNAAIITKDLFK
jgi:hypothetical protein